MRFDELGKYMSSSSTPSPYIGALRYILCLLRIIVNGEDNSAARCEVHVLPKQLHLPSLLCCAACLLQVGLNGVDNGAIRFTHVRIPRVNLLDRFGSVDKSGRYVGVAGRWGRVNA
eukprot:scaffold183506_cov23-Tisochrysis_lutea.AAC.2